ncbi:LamG-like jellyroll fold domain-containing protein [Paraliomyxa miuraensis]|uniref:LamG-like jellyroll fold domain-containing protein n=1 Tax=Paraliomyxa miuraensis TaxID=376150 RepID=UPI00224DB194|nr:LamG-like jellyroll fold domain-containing protein [Paraliomyxa miuraensis]MCX4247916.1 metallophosphoesterase [Paraliomyxa miuraensis]
MPPNAVDPGFPARAPPSYRGSVLNTIPRRFPWISARSLQRSLPWICAALLPACAGGSEGREDASASAGSTTADTEGDTDPAVTTTGTETSADGTGTSADSTGEPPPMLACDDSPPPVRSSLRFDGVDDHVTMGVAPELGLETFTVEAWVRRDGAGEEMGTGSGGLRLVPIAGKGRGENDDTIYNCNYAFGFRGNVLGADFEDSATGANHPVVGTTTVTWGTWHHVAVTYDGATWSLYVDGQLDEQLTVDATPRADSIQHFAIGTAMDSTGAAAGSLDGAVDELRVWNRALDEAEIATGMFQTIVAGEGLVSRWALDEADGGAPDSVGGSIGTIVGATFEADGAVLDRGVPPTVVVDDPPEPPSLPAEAAELELTIADPDSDEHTVTFYLREVSDADDFAIVVLPDTQYYSDVDSPSAGDPQYFHDQTQWVRDNREAYDIRAVIHNGDIVNHGNAPEEWVIANAAMARLETPEPELPEGMPYGVCVGNHDQESNGAVDSTTDFNMHFGVDRFAGRSYYGGHYGDDNDENWFHITVGELEIVVVDLQYDTTPDPAVLAWGRSVFEAHPDALGILNTHYILGGTGNFSAQGQAIYEALKATDNVQLMTCGHVSAESRRTDTYQGNVIHSMLADYQADGDGGSGFLRIWEFSPANDELTVRSYSPSLDQWLTGDDSEFTLEVDLLGAGGDFADVTVVDPAMGVVSAAIPGLEAGRSYEWYATVSDCAHTITTPVRRFTTQP